MMASACGVPLESSYFEALNRENVLLVDVNETPIERIAPLDIQTSAKTYRFDILTWTLVLLRDSRNAFVGGRLWPICT
jgi:hypothetical protein